MQNCSEKLYKELVSMALSQLSLKFRYLCCKVVENMASNKLNINN